MGWSSLATSFYRCGLHICRVGQSHAFIGITVYTRCFWQETHHTYGHIRCVYTVLANPTHLPSVSQVI